MDLSEQDDYSQEVFALSLDLLMDLSEQDNYSQEVFA
jgi:hypothetical protein